MIEDLQPFTVSFLIGLVIGIERERSHPEGTQAAGVRTFILLSLLGAIAAWINSVPIVIILSTFALSAILLGYFRSTEHRIKNENIGLTTEFSAAIVFCLGFLSLKNTLLAAFLGGAVLLVLLSRDRLHAFSRNHIKPEEVQATTIMLVLAVGILPFLPNHTIDPWGLFNPQRFGMLIMAIAAIQFSGYVAIRVFGQNLGMIIMGFFGGLVSSTAVFVTLPRIVRQHPELIYATTAAAILSTIGMLVEFSLILSLASQELLLAVIWPIIAMIVVGLLSIVLVTHNHIKHAVISDPINPLDIKSVLRLSTLIGGMIFLVAFTNHYVGDQGIHALAFLSGLFDVQGISLATATLQTSGTFGLSEASAMLATIIFASYLTKFGLLLSIARDKFAALTATFLLLMLAAGSVTFWFTVVNPIF